MKLFFIISLIILSSSAYCEAPEKRAQFGEYMGKSFSTIAYNQAYGPSSESNFILVDGKEIYTGLKWQCVEYARRWLIENKNVTFPSIKYAYMIWDLEHGERLDTNQSVPMLRFENGTSKTAPQVGDLLIYSPEYVITGHVAVIVGVDLDFESVTIAEQNYFKQPWDLENFSRRLMLDMDKEGNYRIIDASLIGWVHFDLSPDP